MSVITQHGLLVHGYADDLQVYSHAPPALLSDLSLRFSLCLEAVEEWMALASSRLKLNPSKTEIIWLGSRFQLSHCPPGPVNLFNSDIIPSTTVRDLGVMIDSELSLNAHINHIASVCNYHIRQLRLIRHSVSPDAAHALVRALIHSRLDYCNAVLANLHQKQIDVLNGVLRSAARLVLCLPRSAPVSAAMRENLHWLPIPERITFKLCTLTFKCLQGTAPDYLSIQCHRLRNIPGRSQLRSADSGQLLVPVTNLTLGRRGFSYSGPAAWNALPPHLRNNIVSQQTFKRHLKTFLFRRST